MTIEEQISYPIFMELYFMMGQYEGAYSILTLEGTSTPDSHDHKALMPLDIIPESALVD